MKKVRFLIDESALRCIFEKKEKGGELSKMLKQLKDSNSKEVSGVTPMSSFLRAIFLTDPNVKISEVQKALVYLHVVPSLADFKSEEAVRKEVIKFAEVMSN